jgi:DNA-binding FadR family transcriptional regulator
MSRATKTASPRRSRVGPASTETEGAPRAATAIDGVRLGAAGIAARLRQAVRDGVYVEGERLPPERSLAQAFGASRSTLREALRVLETDGMVARRVGSGTFVVWRPGGANADVAEVTSPIELVDVRLGLEPHMVRLATMNATPRDLSLLAETLDAIRAAGDDPERFTRFDRQFHERLAEATHNPLLVALYRQVNHVRGHRQWNAMKDKILTRDRMRAYNDEHSALFAALAARDGETAARLVTRHLERARRDLAGG